MAVADNGGTHIDDVNEESTSDVIKKTHEVIPVSEVEFDAKQAKELAKAKEKDAKEAKKFDEKVKKVEYERKIQQMDMATMLKIMQRQEEMKKNYQKSRDGVTGS